MARRFDARADELAELPFRFAMGLTSGVASGPIFDLLGDALGVHGRHLATAAEHCRELAATCRRRAVACRRFTAEVDRYEREVADAAVRRPPHTFPRRAAWTEYGR